MKKSALCLFGNLGSKVKSSRGSESIIDPEQYFEFINKHLIKYNNLDVFIHTWDSQYNDNLVKLYKPKKYVIEKEINYKPDLKKFSLKYINLYDDIHSLKKENIDPKVFYQNLAYRSKSRWLSQFNSLQLMYSYSLSNSIKYEYVVQSRFDLYFDQKIELAKLDKSKIYIVKRNKFDAARLNDIFFISSFKNSILFKDLYINFYKYPIDPPAAIKIFKEKYILMFTDFFDFKKIMIYRFYLEKKNTKFIPKLFNFILNRFFRLKNIFN